MATHGTLGEFNPTREDWTSYAERLELYFTANDIVTEKKQLAILLSICGAETCSLIRDQMILLSVCGAETCSLIRDQVILLSVCGAETYRLIRDLVAPTKPTEFFFAELVKIVKHHHQPLRLLSFNGFILTLVYRKWKKLCQSLWLAYAG